MRYSKLRFWFRAFLILSIFISEHSAFPASFTVLHAFSGEPDGGGLYGHLAVDAKGNIYGATSGGGEYGEGTVFELTPEDGSNWNEFILHSFCRDYPPCKDGYLPTKGLTLDATGSLYGTTQDTVFGLTPSDSGWTFNVIQEIATFDLIADGRGNLYTEAGLGKCHGGSILKLKPPPGAGYWIPKDIYDFCLHNNEFTKGSFPAYGLSWDRTGNLYGVTGDGGRNGYGVVFQLEHTPHGWKEHVLHSFRLDGQDGFYPQAGVVVDAAGNVYGSTMQGGSHGSQHCGGGCGTIYKLTKQPDGHWKETILYRFPKPNDGAMTTGTLAMDAAGNLYGVAGGTGKDCSCGLVYKFVHNPDDTWTYKVLHKFKGTDGAQPVAGVILDAKGNIYGTTTTGGKGGYGVVFEITP